MGGRAPSGGLEGGVSVADGLQGGLWEGVLGGLRSEVGDEQFRLWMKDTRLRVGADGDWVVSCPSRFVLDGLVRRFQEPISRALRAAMGSEVPLAFEVECHSRGGTSMVPPRSPPLAPE
ncbi:MAG: hypothetical protein HY722_09775, partial [Planctomycetes bacterium]|nr:hypothetical protein [Planctomycetota bacterium]